MNSPDLNCGDCVHAMDGADNRLICRRNGLAASGANAEDFREFVREVGSDDVPMVWFQGAWVCDAGGVV